MRPLRQPRGTVVVGSQGRNGQQTKSGGKKRMSSKKGAGGRRDEKV